MRLLILLILTTFLFSYSAAAQAPRRSCATQDVLQEHLKNYPEIADDMEQIEHHTQTFSVSPQMYNRSALITVPVVVHNLASTT